MNQTINFQPHNIFMGTRALPCPYIEGRVERKVVTDLVTPNGAELYENLSRAGFRRSHSLAYRPACPDCNACVPARIRVEDFEWTRSFRRLIRKNSDLTVLDMAGRATEEQYFLFTRYQRSRHADGEMANMNFGNFKAMIEDSPIDTRIIEFRNNNETLVGTMLADRQVDALSAVYSLFDPDCDKRSLGTYMVLWLVREAIKNKLSYVYLGYWIKESQKMAYKERFRPLEGLTSDGWKTI
ncbi:MAG: arginyltransferase [Pseudomonadota bacterium]|nr:arginyltransferase [Pseudomonadota bacterium]